MAAIALLFLLIAIYIDLMLFKRWDRGLLKAFFSVSTTWFFLSLLIIGTVMAFSPNRWSDLPVLILLLFLPTYLLRRSRLINSPIWKQQCKIAIYLASAMGVVITWIYGVVVFDLFVFGIMDVTTGMISEMGDLLLSAAFSSILIIGLVYQASKRFSGEGFLSDVGLRLGRQSRKKVILLPAVLGLLFAFLSSYIAVSRHIQPQTPLTEIFETTQSLSLILIFLFIAVCIAPLIEEIVFRGYFFRIFKEWIGTKKAVYIIALTFAFLHVGQYWGDWLAILIVAILGFTLTILRAWTGTTIASVTMHYVYNAGVTIIPIIILALTNPAYLEYKANYPLLDAQTKEALLRESIAKQDHLSDAYNDLAWILAQEEKNLDEALTLIEKALHYAPKHPAYLDTKAEILEKLRRHADSKSIRTRHEGELP